MVSFAVRAPFSFLELAIHADDPSWSPTLEGMVITVKGSNDLVNFGEVMVELISVQTDRVLLVRPFLSGEMGTGPTPPRGETSSKKGVTRASSFKRRL